MANNYSKLSREDLIKTIEKLETRKKYGLIWDEERAKEHFEKESQDALPVLKEVKNKEINTNSALPINILIEGDNYHALSVLNYTHQGKVDVIYIDPPYNTGKNDFKYNDKWIDENDSYRHSKWLSFLSKRLRLAKLLLKDDGIMLVSIDDNEMAQLKLLCDEIFGEQNRLSTHHIQVRYGSKNLNEKKDFQELLEYVLIYAKDKYYFEANKPREEYNLDKFNLEINELRKPDKSLQIHGKKVDIFLKKSYSITKKVKGDIDLFKETWLSGSIYSGTGHGKTYQKIVENRVKKDGLGTLYKIYGLGADGLGYRYMINPQKDSSTRGKMFTKVPTAKRKGLKSGDSEISRPIINYYDFSPDFGNIRHEGGVAFNSGKKPVKMLKQLVNYHKNKDAIILDFFAGSGSTAHAVLALNQEDDGSRSFILCTDNEGNICTNVCYPRVRNVIKGYRSTKGLGGNLKYFKTDFVKRSINRDELKMRITKRCTEMLCLREMIYNEIKQTNDYRIFRNNGNVLAVYYSLGRRELRNLKKYLDKMKGKKTLYCFTLDPLGLDRNDFQNWEDVSLEPIPQKILDIYEDIYDY